MVLTSESVLQGYHYLDTGIISIFEDSDTVLVPLRLHKPFLIGWENYSYKITALRLFPIGETI